MFTSVCPPTCRYNCGESLSRVAKSDGFLFQHRLYFRMIIVQHANSEITHAGHGQCGRHPMFPCMPVSPKIQCKCFDGLWSALLFEPLQ